VRAGWYIHHHGLGHLQRFRIMRRQLPGLVGLSSLPRPAEVPAREWVALPDDAPAPAGADVTAGGTLHWAPAGHDGLRSRMAAVAAWVQDHRPEVLVVDVSVEVALFARLMGVPVVWVGQRGRRVDGPHRLAYGLSRVVVPWTTEVASDDGDPDGVVHVGALSRFDGRAARPAPGHRRVLLVLGRGGHGIAPAAVAAARAATPDWTWETAGLDGELHDPEALWDALQRADVVVGSAGTGVVSEVAAARRPLICLPQPRPFGEQHEQARALARAGLAETLTEWPAADRWPQILERARVRDPQAWALLHDGQAAQRMADAIRAAAATSTAEALPCA
jgi:hypothetical protein